MKKRSWIRPPAGFSDRKTEPMEQILRISCERETGRKQHSWGKYLFQIFHLGILIGKKGLEGRDLLEKTVYRCADDLPGAEQCGV